SGLFHNDLDLIERRNAAIANVALPVGKGPQVSKNCADQPGFNLDLPFVKPFVSLEILVFPCLLRNLSAQRKTETKASFFAVWHRYLYVPPSRSRTCSCTRPLEMTALPA